MDGNVKMSKNGNFINLPQLYDIMDLPTTPNLLDSTAYDNVDGSIITTPFISTLSEGYEVPDWESKNVIFANISKKPWESSIFTKNYNAVSINNSGYIKQKTNIQYRGGTYILYTTILNNGTDKNIKYKINFYENNQEIRPNYYCKYYIISKNK